MLSRIRNDEMCDARDDDSSKNAGNKIKNPVQTGVQYYMARSLQLKARSFSNTHLH